MDDRVLDAVAGGHRTFSTLVEALDADAGEAFLTCRHLVEEGLLAETGPLVFEVTGAGRDRVDARSDAEDGPVPTGGDGDDTGEAAGDAGTAEPADRRETEAASDGPPDGAEGDQGAGAASEDDHLFDFAATYEYAGESSGADATEGSPGAHGDPPAPSETADGADPDGEPVTAVRGVGSAYAERLREAGVRTVADLAAADPGELAAATDISESRIERWQDRSEAAGG